ncbi:MAG TPA: hypothetical protein DCZ76_09460 [Treponema sp.]|nr:hypothetical protein [Treponema sp.]
MEGGLAARRFATQISDPRKNPRMDFSEAPYARLEGRRSRPPQRSEEAGAVAEPWKAGDERHGRSN